MMIVRLFCPYCAYEAAQTKKNVTIDVPVPVAELSDNGHYQVVCEKAHQSSVRLLNLKFELLFEMGLNAIVDGYYREAVTSFASSLERFYEFYWLVAMHKFSVTGTESAIAWKPMSNMSERQIGGYITASLILAGKSPTLLNTNKEIPFRNSVVHKGYVPSGSEAIAFGDTVKILIETELDVLRRLASESLKEVYESLLPKADERIEKSEAEIAGAVNILTAIDVLTPPNTAEGDVRAGTITEQFDRILREREPHRMHVFQTDEERKEYMEKNHPSQKL